MSRLECVTTSSGLPDLAARQPEVRRSSCCLGRSVRFLACDVSRAVCIACAGDGLDSEHGDSVAGGSRGRVHAPSAAASSTARHASLRLAHLPRRRRGPYPGADCVARRHRRVADAGDPARRSKATVDPRGGRAGVHLASAWRVSRTQLVPPAPYSATPGPGRSARRSARWQRRRRGCRNCGRASEDPRPYREARPPGRRAEVRSHVLPGRERVVCVFAKPPRPGEVKTRVTSGRGGGLGWREHGPDCVVRACPRCRMYLGEHRRAVRAIEGRLRELALPQASTVSAAFIRWSRRPEKPPRFIRGLDGRFERSGGPSRTVAPGVTGSIPVGRLGNCRTLRPRCGASGQRLGFIR